MAECKLWKATSEGNTGYTIVTINADEVKAENGVLILSKGGTPVAYFSLAKCISVVDTSAIDNTQATSYGS